MTSPPGEVEPRGGRGRRFPEAGLKRVLLLLLCLALAGVTLFPPWAYTYAKPGMSPALKPAPRVFILAPPTPRSGNYAGISLDLHRLVTEFVAVLLVAGAVYALALLLGDVKR